LHCNASVDNDSLSNEFQKLTILNPRTLACNIDLQSSLQLQRLFVSKTKLLISVYTVWCRLFTGKNVGSHVWVLSVLIIG